MTKERVERILKLLTELERECKEFKAKSMAPKIKKPVVNQVGKPKEESHG